MIKKILFSFSLPIFLGIISGLLFPFQALQLIFLSSSFLFLLMFINSLAIDSTHLFRPTAHELKMSVLFLVFSYIFFPCALINLAQLFLTDSNYVLGLALSSLAPAAFVVPLFARARQGSPRQAILNITISTLFFPLISPYLLAMFSSADYFINIQSVLLILFVITLLPLLLGLFVAHKIPLIKEKLTAHAPVLNSALLGILMFILCGSSFNKLRPTHLLEKDILYTVLLLILLDFGVYAFMKFLAKPWFQQSQSESLALSVSLRNLAIPAVLLLSFQPKAAIVPGIGLIVHAFFFQWLLNTKNPERI